MPALLISSLEDDYLSWNEIHSSWMRLIWEINFLLWHIHISRQYTNCDNKCIHYQYTPFLTYKIRIWARAWSFCLALLQRLVTCDSKFDLLSNTTTPSNISSLLLVMLPKGTFTANWLPFTFKVIFANNKF